MIALTRAGRRLARTLFLCLVLGPLPVQADDLLAWRAASTLPELTAELDRWLDVHTDLPRRADSPEIRWIDRAAAADLSGRRPAGGGHTRGLYDPETATIWLVRPWSARDPFHVSVLLHELVHHRQVAAGHWYCPGAQELPAYRAQRDWLAALGLEGNVNWIAVVLESGCTRRDIHPD